MDIIYRDLPGISPPFLPVDPTDHPKVLFIDIETTGFVARSSKLYLIGCAYFKDDSWHTAQFFADRYSDEEELLNEFADFAADHKILVHFNGNTFDIPYLKAKFREYGITLDLDVFEGIDIYRRINPYKDFLLLENCKQKTVERFLGLDREDRFSGGELIDVYSRYCLNPDPADKELLLLHNYEDVKGMLEITPILAYSDLFNGSPRVLRVYASYTPDFEGKEKGEVMIEFIPPSSLPVPVSCHRGGCHVTIDKDHGLMAVPVFKGELKYFFANYEDYYYLPMEDMAVHKSVSSFVDPKYREQARASNCYAKKEGAFLPQWDELVTPFFKRDYKDRELFFEITEDIKQDRELFSRYVLHVLNRMV